MKWSSTESERYETSLDKSMNDFILYLIIKNSISLIFEYILNVSI